MAQLCLGVKKDLLEYSRSILSLTTSEFETRREGELPSPCFIFPSFDLSRRGELQVISWVRGDAPSELMIQFTDVLGEKLYNILASQLTPKE